MKHFLENFGTDIHVIANVFESITDLVFLMEVCGNDFKYIYVNESGRRVLNMGRGILGRTIDEVVSQQMSNVLIPQYEKVYSTKKPVRFTEKLETESGEFIGETSLTPIKIEGGECKYILAIVRDITELKKAQRELQKSEEKYRLITENAFDVIKLVSTVGIVEYVSPSNEQILGYAPEEYIGKEYTAYVHQEDVSILKKGFKYLLHNRDEQSTVQVRMQHKNNDFIWMETIITSIIDDEEVKQLLMISRDITERKRLKDELEKAAFYDFLSGLPNRRTFNDRLDMAIHQAERSNKKVAVMMLDGRRFKQINDRYGHAAGDAVIKEMARRIQECVRKTDTVARLGGDEMAIILPELDRLGMAEDIAKRILIKFEEPLYFNGSVITMGLEIGIAFYPDHATKKRHLVKLADEALYEAKEFKYNNYRIYPPLNG